MNKQLKEISSINKKIENKKKKDEGVNNLVGDLDYFLNDELGIVENLQSVLSKSLELFNELEVDCSDDIKNSVQTLIQGEMTSKLILELDSRLSENSIRHAEILEMMQKRTELCKLYNKEHMPNNVKIFNTGVFSNPHKAIKELEFIADKDNNMQLEKINNKIIFIGNNADLSYMIKDDGKYLKSVAKSIKEDDRVLTSIESMPDLLYIDGKIIEAKNLKQDKKKNTLKR
jgi:hypothetical protein